MIQLSFAEIYTQVQNFIQDTSSGTLTIIKDEINREYERIAAAGMWPELVKEINESLSYTTNEAYLALPGDAATILQLSDKSNSWTVANRSLLQLIDDNIDVLSTQADVLYYAELGYKPTRRPISTADLIQVLSSSASDTTQTVRVAGLLNSTLITQVESIALNGITAVDSANTYRAGWSLDSVGTNGTLVGSVTIREKTSGTILGYIPKDRRESSWYVIRLDRPPATADNLNVVYKQRVNKLSNDNDVPVLPIGNYLVEKTISKMREYDKKYAQAQIHNQQAGAIISSILSERRLQPNRVRQARPQRQILQRGF